MRQIRHRFIQLLQKEEGFAAAESVVLALLLSGVGILVGSILQRAATQAAQNLNNELAGSAKN